MQPLQNKEHPYNSIQYSLKLYGKLRLYAINNKKMGLSIAPSSFALIAYRLIDTRVSITSCSFLLQVTTI